MDMLPLVMPGDAGPAFDYASLPAEMVLRRQEQASRIRGMYRQTVETAGEIARELLTAQAEMEHGQFLPWVTGAVGLSKSTAYRCMDMARAFGPKLPTVGTLPLAVIHKLSEKSTPEPIRAAVLRRIEAGEVIHPEAIVSEIREARDEARQQSAAQREAERRAALSDEKRAEEDELRARGERGRAARERKLERERLAAQAERDRKDEASVEAAQVLVEMIGLDRAAAYIAHYGMAACSKLEDVVAIARARAVPPVETPASNVDNFGAMFGFLSNENRPRVEAIAQEIKQDGLTRAPVVVLRSEHRGIEHYRVIDGVDTFRALHEVLGWQSVPVHIPPPVTEADFALLPEVKAGA